MTEMNYISQVVLHNYEKKIKLGRIKMIELKWGVPVHYVAYLARLNYRRVSGVTFSGIRTRFRHFWAYIKSIPCIAFVRVEVTVMQICLSLLF